MVVVNFIQVTCFSLSCDSGDPSQRQMLAIGLQEGRVEVIKVIMLNIHHAHFTNHSVIRTIMLITSTNCAYYALVMLTN